MILLQYFLKLSVSLAVIYLFYYFILRRLTFYHHNRWYLSGYSLLCFFIALININPVLEKNQLLDNEIVKAFPTVNDLTADPGDPVVSANSQGWSLWHWMVLIFLLGFLLLVVRLVLQYISFCRIKNKAELLTDGPLKLYQVNKTIIPFSFGKSIFINQSQHEEQELKEIIHHEFVHVKQKHTIDIIWSELLCALNWFNPFAWLLRKAIRQNLEFIADNNVLESGMDKKQYQYLLLKVIGISQFSIANQFNFSSLKKRIAMMNKIKTARVQLIKSLFVLPVIAMLLLAFRSQMNNTVTARHETNNALDTLPKNVWIDNKVAISLHRSDKMDDEHRAFFTRHPEIELLHWKKDGSLQIYLTKERIEHYSPAEIEKAEAKYGKLPAVVEGSHAVGILIRDTVPEQTIPNDKGYLIDIKDNKGHCEVVVKDKGKKIVEKIDFLKWNASREKYEELYGEIPAVPVVPVTATMVNSELAIPVEGVSLAPVTVIGLSQNSVPSKISAASIPTEVRTVSGVALTANTPVEFREVVVSGHPLTAKTPVEFREVVVSDRPLTANTPIEGREVVVSGHPLTTNTPVEAREVVVSGQPLTAHAPAQQAIPVETVIDAVETGEKIMELKIYRSTKKADLDKLISQAKANGLELVFDEIKYNEKDQLVTISGELKKGDGKVNFNASDFVVVRLLLFKKDGILSMKVIISEKGEIS